MKVEVFDFETEETKVLTIQQFQNDFNNDLINSSNTKIKFIDE